MRLSLYLVLRVVAQLLLSLTQQSAFHYHHLTNVSTGAIRRADTRGNLNSAIARRTRRDRKQTVTAFQQRYDCDLPVALAAASCKRR
jgi:hypothetical protein